MSPKDQRKYLEALKRYEHKFTSQETEEYKMFLKRNKDEEEFDSLSLKRLKELYDKYHLPVDIHKYDTFFKKKTDGE
jgi:hypothetical protein